MKNTISNLYSQLIGRKRQKQIQVASDLRTLCQLIGDSELGGQYIEIDSEDFAETLIAEGWLEADLRLNVDRYKLGVQKRKVADEIEARQAAVVAADLALQEADLKEGERRRTALAHL